MGRQIQSKYKKITLRVRGLPTYESGGALPCAALPVVMHVVHINPTSMCQR